MAIRRQKIASVADSDDASKIQPSDLDPEAVPASPANGDIRTERTGVSPDRYLRLLMYDNGAWRTVAEGRY